MLSHKNCSLRFPLCPLLHTCHRLFVLWCFLLEYWSSRVVNKTCSQQVCWWRECGLNQTARLCINVRFLQDFIVWPKWPVTESARQKRLRSKRLRPKRPDRKVLFWKFRMVFYNFCYHFWGQRGCWTCKCEQNDYYSALFHWTQANNLELVVRQNHGRPQGRTGISPCPEMGLRINIS